MSDFQFREPLWGLGLVAGFLLPGILMTLRRMSATRREPFVSRTMMSRLIVRGPAWRTALADWTAGSVVGFLSLALMRPQWGMIPAATSRAGAEVMICLDVSKSMLAEDVTPNRLQRAKADIHDLLSRLEGEQVGLIAFAGRPVLLSPLTSDFGFLKLILDAAGPHTVGRGGTRLELALQRALAAFQKSSDVSKVVLLITDGGETGGNTNLASQLAHRQDVRVIVIGIGDEAGTSFAVPDPRTGKQNTVQDQQGTPVISRLESQRLRDLANATQGLYIPAGTASLDLRDLYRVHFAPLLRARHQEVQREYKNEGYQVPLILAIFSFLLAIWAQTVPRGQTPLLASNGHRRSSSLPSGVMLCAMLMSVSARTPFTAAQTIGREDDDPQAFSLREGFLAAVKVAKTDPKTASGLFERIYLDRNADQALRFHAKYNLGWLAATAADQVLAEDPQQALSQLVQAQDAFQDAVQLDPNNLQARQNLELVADRARQLRDAQQPPESNASKQIDELSKKQQELNQQLDSADSSSDLGEQTRQEDEQQEEKQKQATGQQEQLSEETEQLSQKSEEEVAEMLQEAAQEMKEAAKQLANGKDGREQSREAREKAVEKLEQARDRQRALDQEAQAQTAAEPPNQEQNTADELQAQQAQDPPPDQGGFSQLLQLIRDREAQRAQQRRLKEFRSDEPVSEDW